MSERIAVANGGRIEPIGTTTEIYHAPATAFLANESASEEAFHQGARVWCGRESAGYRGGSWRTKGGGNLFPEEFFHQRKNHP